jgi:hypothetical protein
VLVSVVVEMTGEVLQFGIFVVMESGVVMDSTDFAVVYNGVLVESLV